MVPAAWRPLPPANDILCNTEPGMRPTQPWANPPAW